MMKQKQNFGYNTTLINLENGRVNIKIGMTTDKLLRLEITKMEDDMENSNNGEWVEEEGVLKHIISKKENMEHEYISNMNDMKTNDDLTLIQTYYDEAKTKLWRQYYVDKNNQKQGEYKYLHEDGRIDTIRNYKDGRWHGKYQRWWDNGRSFFVDTRHFKKGWHGTNIIFGQKKK